MKLNAVSVHLLSSAEIIARKMHTLSSVWIMGLRMTRDRQDPRHFDHAERLKYLELRSALSWKDDIVVYDIGANVGSFADFVARLGTVSKVYCFEPAAQVFDQLLRNCRRTRKVECFQLALGDRSENRIFHVNEFTPSSSFLPLQPTAMKEFPHVGKTSRTELEIATLSEIVAQRHLLAPDFIKVDVQGYEDRVIRGGEDIFRRARFCMLEISLVSLYEGSALAVEMNALMRRMDFKLVSILDQKVTGERGEILQFDAVYENSSYALHC